MKPLILITNDDGYDSPGIRTLIDLLKKKGDVIVVAPLTHQSAMSHAITTLIPITYQEIEKTESYKEYSCKGTPVDCVKLALSELVERKPDLVVSGINHGSNSSTNVIYSGTMAAAIEGSVSGIPSLGISLQDNSLDADFTACVHYTELLVDKVLNGSWDKTICLNVNVPKAALNEIKGVKICRQSCGVWHEEFDKKENKEGNTDFMLGGWFEPDISDDKGDDYALSQNYVSVVPVQYDFTDHNMVTQLSKWND
ncbi:MAG: 5'/3'-nucleotidase SurE [Flavobacteriales bacterium]|nr:5'/3'-nucleotidase SurE [Flavobacteriales bacterium]